jgi:formylglycine-generating enzyme required for sulfatase activity
VGQARRTIMWSNKWKCLLLFFFCALCAGAFSVQAADNTYTNSIGMEFVLIPAGSFMMGSPAW